MKKLVIIGLFALAPLCAVTQRDLAEDLAALSERVNDLIAQGKENADAINKLLGKIETLEKEYGSQDDDADGKSSEN